MEANKYRCAQPELYSAARMVIRAAIRNIASFTPKKPKYDLVFFTALQAEVAACDEQSRNSFTEALHILLESKAKACLNIWQDLKGYIEDAPTMQGDLQKPALEAAGAAYYRNASGNDWESVNQLMVSARAFISDNAAELSDGNNMPPTFPPDFATAHTAFKELWEDFQDQEEQSVIDAQEKVEANNALYDKIIQVCKDGQRIYRDDEARKAQFVWDSVLYLVRGAGIAGIRGTVTDAASGNVISGATVLVVETEETGVADEEGIYRITGLAAGNYTVRCTAVGYATEEKPFEVLTGTISTVNFSLSV
jgi:hypothetical protein